jgi:apolipoprotein D and lipocalin family protein
MLQRFATLVLLACTLALAGCIVRVPDGVTPVSDFALDPYLGRWYEIARLDHSFERGLSNVSAEYSMRDDGGVRVLNRGYDTAKGEWDEAEGRAYLVENEHTGFLKVAFFGPFYGSYVIINHDPAEYALVSGPYRSYLWILSRSPQLPQQTRERLVAEASRLGFDVDALIWVEQDAATAN